MSVSDRCWRRRAQARAVLGLSCWLAGSLSAWAFDIPDLLTDPLQSRPPALERGPHWPGDDLLMPCPPHIDLTEVLTIGDAVDLALCFNPKLKATWAAIKIQSGVVGEARSAYLPTLTGSLSVLRNRTRFPDAPANDNQRNGHTVYAGLNWRLFDFGGRAANRTAANDLLAAALLSHDAALQKTLAAVVGAYFDVLTTQAAMAARADATRLAAQTLATTRHREQKGAVAQSDTLQASTALAKAQLAEQRARGEQQKALSVLIYAMGIPASTVLHLADSPAPLPSEAARDLETWLADAAARHPAILAARAQQAATQAKVTMARAEGLPTIDFTSNYYQNGYPNQALQATQSHTTTLGLTLTIPVFEGFARTYKIRGAEAQAEQSTAQMEETEHQVLAEIVKAYADTQSSLANLASSANLLQAAEASVASSEKRYAKGAADVLEMLAAQSTLADAQQERVRCLSEWRSAQLRLMASAGMLEQRNVRP